MRSTPAFLLALSLLSPRIGEAQSSPQAAVSDSTSEQTAPAPKKKGGMFGKMKGLAKNKVVKSVAKMALCTAVPGGQLVAGAIDAAKTKNVAGAAGAVAGVAGGSSSCMPGMSGMAGNGVAAATGAVAGSLVGGGVPGMPTSGMAGAAMSAAQMMQMQEQYKKMGMDPAQLAAMQQMMASMQGGAGAAQMSPAQLQQMQAQMAQMQGGRMPSGQMPVGAPGMPPQAGGPEMGMPGEAGGKSIELSSDLVRDLKKGKTVIRYIDWSPGTGAVTAEGSEGFTRAMAQVSAAMKQAGGSYRIDLYMNQESGDVVVRTLGPQRLSAVQAAFLAGGAATDAAAVPQIGKAKKDKDPRLEIVKAK